MIVEYVRYKMPTGEAQKLIDAYAEGAASLRASPHCHGYELTQCSESAETLVVRILWDSADGHMKGFRTSEQFKAFFVAVKPFVANIEEMRHYDLTEVRWTR
jgi:quinol monooxygenase YgiN